MKRTVVAIVSCMVWAAGSGVAQAAGAAAAQPDRVAELVATMRKAEQELKSLAVDLRSHGRLQGGVEMTTTGQLRVLRGTQADLPPRLYTRFDYAFADGLRGQFETAWTEAGIQLFEEDPAFGAVYVRIAPSIVRDLEWAGTVLGRSDLPGMPDGRASSPLGSGIVTELRRTFDLVVDERTARDGDSGTWLIGTVKKGLDEQDPDLPAFDRVELFVRATDHVLLCVRYFVGKDVVQEIEVTRVELDGDVPETTFVVDGRGLRVRDVQAHQPLWEQIERTVGAAEAKAKDGVVRPSRR